MRWLEQKKNVYETSENVPQIYAQSFGDGGDVETQTAAKTIYFLTSGLHGSDTSSGVNKRETVDTVIHSYSDLYASLVDIQGISRLGWVTSVTRPLSFILTCAHFPRVDCGDKT